MIPMEEKPRKEVKVEETDIPDTETGFPSYLKGSVIRGKYIPINKKTWIDIEIDGNDAILDCASQVVPLMIKKPSIFLTIKEEKKEKLPEKSSASKKAESSKNQNGENEKLNDNNNQAETLSKSKDGKENNEDVEISSSEKSEKTESKKETDENEEIVVESDNDDKQENLNESNKSTMLTISDYYKSSVGNLLMGIGLSRSKEWYHKDIIRQIHRGIRKQGELDELVDDLKRQQQFYNECKAANSIFTFKLKKCEICEFKCESDIVIEGHYSIPHLSHRKEFKCNFCPFLTRDSQAISYHFRNTHNKHCVIENPPLLYACSICPYESSQKAKAATHIAKCLKFFNPDKVQALPDPESEYPAITPKLITQEDIKIYEATLLALRTAALSPHAQLPNIPGLPRGLQQQMLLMQQQQVAQQSRALRANKNLHGLKGNVAANSRAVGNFDLTNSGNTNFAKSSAPQLYHMLQAGGHTQLVPLPQKYPQGVNSTTHLQAVKGRVISGTGGSALMQKTAGMRFNNSDDSASGVKGGTFVICEICDGYIKDLEQLRTHMQWIHKVIFLLYIIFLIFFTCLFDIIIVIIILVFLTLTDSFLFSLNLG